MDEPSQGCAYLLLHARLQQHHDAGFHGQSDLPAAPLQVLVQPRAKRWLLRPRVCRGKGTPLEAQTHTSGPTSVTVIYLHSQSDAVHSI